MRAAPGYAAYAAAKAGVINYTKTAALELAPHGIRVNALAPDITMTEGIAAVAPPGARSGSASRCPMGRAGHVDEMAGAAVFLASRAVQLHHRSDDPRRRRDPRGQRVVSPPGDGRVRPRADTLRWESENSHNSIALDPLIDASPPRPEFFVPITGFNPRCSRTWADIPPSTAIICPVM